ncbi:MAG: hypothetical protein IPF66_19745 [Holophagales bacterium]|nr:hypothetical protein [Holophagales bacterium]
MAELTREERICLRSSPLQVTGPEKREEAAADAYRNSQIQNHEFVGSEDPLAWDAEGWEDVERTFALGGR